MFNKKEDKDDELSPDIEENFESDYKKFRRAVINFKMQIKIYKAVGSILGTILLALLSFFGVKSYDLFGALDKINRAESKMEEIDENIENINSNFLGQMANMITSVGKAVSISDKMDKKINEEIVPKIQEMVKKTANEEIKEQAYKLIPKGTVVAFNNKKGCPEEGWRPFKNGEGKAIIGVDAKDKDFLFGKNSNKKKINLKRENMPKHRHAAGDLKADNPDFFSHASGYSTPFDKKNRKGALFKWKKESNDFGHHTHPISGNTDWEGEGKGIKILPPYVALYLCEKK